MAHHAAARKGKVVHRQTFQNSNSITELTLRTYPKDEIPLPIPTKPFVRDCALEKEIKRIEKEKKMKIKQKEPREKENVRVERGDGDRRVQCRGEMDREKETERAAQNKVPPDPLESCKPSGGRISVEVTRKKSRKRAHPHLGHNETWEDALRECSSISSHSRSTDSEPQDERIGTREKPQIQPSKKNQPLSAQTHSQPADPSQHSQPQPQSPPPPLIRHASQHLPEPHFSQFNPVYSQPASQLYKTPHVSNLQQSQVPHQTYQPSVIHNFTANSQHREFHPAPHSSNFQNLHPLNIPHTGLHSNFPPNTSHTPQHTSHTPIYTSPHISQQAPHTSHAPQYILHPPPDGSHSPSHISHPPPHTSHPFPHNSHPSLHTSHPPPHTLQPPPQPSQSRHNLNTPSHTSKHSHPRMQHQESRSIPPHERRASSTEQEVPSEQRRGSGEGDMGVHDPPESTERISQSQDSAHPDPEGARNVRLLSDDTNASPFGTSALMLLQQLKDRLRARGDSDSSDLVVALEAYISGRGSLGGVGSINLNNADIAPHQINQSIHTSSVFQTPEESQNTSHQKHLGDEAFLTSVSRDQQFIYKQTELRRPPELSDFSETESGHAGLSQCQDRQSDANQINQGQKGTSYVKLKLPLSKDSHDSAKLLAEIDRQKAIMEEQERDISRLKKLSTKLIAQQEQINQGQEERRDKGVSPSDSVSDQNTGEDSGLGRGRSKSISTESGPIQDMADSENRREGNIKGGMREEDTVDTEINNLREENRTLDSVKNGDSVHQPRNDDLWQEKEREYKAMILDLQTANEALLQEITRLRELVVNLELKLTRMGQPTLEQRPISSLSKLTSSAPNLSVVDERQRVRKMSSQSNTNTSSENDADSAYEERTGSYLTSKTNSPHLDPTHPSFHPATVSHTTLGHQKPNQYIQGGWKRMTATNPEHGQEMVNLAHSQDFDIAAQPSTSGHKVSERKTYPEYREIECENIATPRISERKASYPKSSRIDCNIAVPSIMAHKATFAFGDQRSSQSGKFSRVGGAELNIHPSSSLNLVKALTMSKLKVGNLSPTPWTAPEEQAFSSFSTVCDQQLNDSKVTIESSFLQGVNVPEECKKINTSALPPRERNEISESAPLESLEAPFESSFLQGIKTPQLCKKTDGKELEHRSTFSGTSQITSNLPFESTRVHDISPKSSSEVDEKTVSVPLNTRPSTASSLNTDIEQVDLLD